MMRRLLLPSILLLVASPCFSEAFLSNALGQDLGAVEALTGEGYEGERDGTATRIYLDGEVIRTRIEDDGGYTVESGDEREIVRLNEDGSRSSWTLSTPEHEEIHTYFYDDGRLSSMSVSVDGVLERRIIYLDTPSGALSGFSGTYDAYLSPDFYLYQLDGGSVRLTYHGDGRVTRSDASMEEASYEVEEDGSWKETQILPDGSERISIYSPDGRLERVEEGGSVVSYGYDEDGELVLETRTEGSSENRIHYEDGRISSTEELSDGIMIKERHHRADGGIEEIRYRNGKPEYSILFEGDGVRVKEIRRL